MKPFPLLVALLFISILFSCKKNKREFIYTPPIDTIRIPTVDPIPGDTANFISMKIDGKLYADSVTLLAMFHKSMDPFTTLDIQGYTEKGEKTMLFVGISLPDHKIKTGSYGKVEEGYCNTIQWIVYHGNDLSLREDYVVFGDNPAVPFMIRITRSDDTSVEGIFSGKASGKNSTGQLVVKEITDGTFRIATKKIKNLN
jgi:hypothetical protein